MQLGVVPYINARPLSFGLKKRNDVQIIEDLPSRLFDRVGKGLDAALISSVEYLRNPDLTYCDAVGVCARDHVQSILFVRPATASEDNPPSVLLMDSGSRTSVALLSLLVYTKWNQHTPVQAELAARIPEMILSQENAGGLLIGDGALRFQMRPDKSKFRVLDLSTWWYEKEKLPFVFAVWAYPRKAAIDSALFEESLASGLSSIEEIISGAAGEWTGEDRLKGEWEILIRKYLTECLHYRLTDDDRKSLVIFRERLEAAGLF